MKVTVAIVIALITVGALIAAFAAGYARGRAHNYHGRLQQLGLNDRSATLYVRAVKILLRLNQAVDLEGLAAGERLSAETKKLGDDWSIDYRIGVSKQ